MMNTMRKSVGGWIAKPLMGLIVVAFVVTGFSSFFSGAAPTAVVSAGGTDVLVQDYRLAYRQAEAQLARQLQRRPTREEAISQGIDRRVLSQLVSEAVLDEQGRNIGLGLSEERLARLIADDPSFHDASGRFSRNSFRELLSSVGMRENDFIRNREQAAVRSQIVESISEGAATPELVKQAFGLYAGERRTAEYLTLPVALVQPVAEPAPEALQTFFDGRKQRYAAPEYRSIAYAALTPDAVSDPAKVTQAEIDAAYAKDTQKFTTPERRRIEQIVYPDKAKADAARAELAGGKTFEQLVIDTGRTLADTELGMLGRGEIPDPALAEAAFALRAGDVSAPVEGAFGTILVRVTEIQPEVKKPLSEVQEEIRKEIALSSASEALRSGYDAYEEARGSGASLEEAAGRAGLTIKTVPAVTQSGRTPEGTDITDIPAQQAVLTAAFESEVGVENQPVDVRPNGFVFFEVTKVDPAHERPLDEVRAQVVDDWKAVEATRLLGERAEALKKRLDAGETLDALAASEKLAKQVAASISRESGAQEIGDEASRAVFAGPEGLTAVADAADGAAKLLLKVTAVAAPLDPLASFPADQNDQLSAMIKQDIVQSYVNVLQDEYRVVSYPAAIQAAQQMPQ
jgi:peptidyl-prolyl cis-trans isomerase D